MIFKIKSMMSDYQIHDMTQEAKTLREKGIYRSELILGEEQVDIRMIHDIATIPQLNEICARAGRKINDIMD